jgi:hypothetical protein
MLIFLDTNIFYNNWHLKNAQWGLLSNFIHNTGAVLLLSDLVCEEVQNIQEKQVIESVAAIQAEINKLDKLNESKITFDPSSLIQAYNFKSIVENRIRDVIYLPYDMIEQRPVVHRAVKRIRPFQDEDKGYRDTLIWLSLLHYLRETKNQTEVVFINDNSTDFYNKNEKKFHTDLQNDIQDHALTCSFNINNSLYEFLGKILASEDHAINYEEFNDKYLNENDSLIQDSISDYLEYLPHPEFRQLIIKENGERPELAYSNDHEFEIMEGIEDPELLACKKVSKNSFYINYKFNLRICAISFTIPEPEFEANKTKILLNYQEAEILDHGVVITGFHRIDVIISFNLTTDNLEIDGLSVEHFKFRR